MEENKKYYAKVQSGYIFSLLFVSIVIMGFLLNDILSPSSNDSLFYGYLFLFVLMLSMDCFILFVFIQFKRKVSYLLLQNDEIYLYNAFGKVKKASIHNTIDVVKRNDRISFITVFDENQNKIMLIGPNFEIPLEDVATIFKK